MTYKLSSYFTKSHSVEFHKNGFDSIPKPNNKRQRNNGEFRYRESVSRFMAHNKGHNKLLTSRKAAAIKNAGRRRPTYCAIMDVSESTVIFYKATGSSFRPLQIHAP